MRISDWSSDVCSSDLRDEFAVLLNAATEGSAAGDGAALLAAFTVLAAGRALDWLPAPPRRWIVFGGGRRNPVQIGRASCRVRVCPYVEISVVAVSVKTKNT